MIELLRMLHNKAAATRHANNKAMPKDCMEF